MYGLEFKIIINLARANKRYSSLCRSRWTGQQRTLFFPVVCKAGDTYVVITNLYINKNMGMDVVHPLSDRFRLVM